MGLGGRSPVGIEARLPRGWLAALSAVRLGRVGNTVQRVVRPDPAPPLPLAVSGRLGLLPADSRKFARTRAGQHMQEGREVRWSGRWIAPTGGLVVSRV